MLVPVLFQNSIAVFIVWICVVLNPSVVRSASFLTISRQYYLSIIWLWFQCSRAASIITISNTVIALVLYLLWNFILRCLILVLYLLNQSCVLGTITKHLYIFVIRVYTTFTVQPSISMAFVVFRNVCIVSISKFCTVSKLVCTSIGYALFIAFPCAKQGSNRRGDKKIHCIQHHYIIQISMYMCISAISSVHTYTKCPWTS